LAARTSTDAGHPSEQVFLGFSCVIEASIEEIGRVFKPHKNIQSTAAACIAGECSLDALGSPRFRPMAEFGVIAVKVCIEQLRSFPTSRTFKTKRAQEDVAVLYIVFVSVDDMVTGAASARYGEGGI
jgi:hypothetical protein